VHAYFPARSRRYPDVHARSFFLSPGCPGGRTARVRSRLHIHGQFGKTIRFAFSSLSFSPFFHTFLARMRCYRAMRSPRGCFWLLERRLPARPSSSACIKHLDACSRMSDRLNHEAMIPNQILDSFAKGHFRKLSSALNSVSRGEPAIPER